MTPVITLDALADKLRKLNFVGEKIQILADIADALAKKVDGSSESQDPILGRPQFYEYFANVLLIHHATNDDKFKKKAFEFAFRGACAALGLKADISASQTNPGADVTIDGKTKFSLKTEAEQKISRNSIKISKLMEARWIRDLKDKDDRGTEAAGHVLEHLKQYERILTLRAFDVETAGLRTHIEYQLWEIPKTKLQLVSTLRKEDFSAPTKNNSFAARVFETSPDGKRERVFSLRMDGSVEKITVGSLDSRVCIKHAGWLVPVDPPRQPDVEDEITDLIEHITDFVAAKTCADDDDES